MRRKAFPPTSHTAASLPAGHRHTQDPSQNPAPHIRSTAGRFLPLFQWTTNSDVRGRSDAGISWGSRTMTLKLASDLDEDESAIPTHFRAIRLFYNRSRSKNTIHRLLRPGLNCVLDSKEYVKHRFWFVKMRNSSISFFFSTVKPLWPGPNQNQHDLDFLCLSTGYIKCSFLLWKPIFDLWSRSISLFFSEGFSSFSFSQFE